MALRYQMYLVNWECQNFPPARLKKTSLLLKIKSYLKQAEQQLLKCESQGVYSFS